MSEHTPGPWKVDSKYCVGPVSQEDDQSYGMIIPVADVYGPNRKADAELIASAPQLREQNRVLRGLVVYVEQIEADLHAALNGTRHDPSWIRPIQLSRNERQELYLGCLKQLQALKAALTATSQEGSMDNEQRCGTCRWWKIHDGQENRTDCATGDCTYPLPICLPDEYRITPYAKAGKDCPTWHAK